MVIISLFFLLIMLAGAGVFLHRIKPLLVNPRHRIYLGTGLLLLILGISGWDLWILLRFWGLWEAYLIPLTIAYVLQISGFLISCDFALRWLRSQKTAVEQLPEMLVDRALVGVYLIQDQRLQYANPRAAEILGWELSQLIGADPLDVVLPEDRELVREQITRRLRGDVDTVRYRFRVKRPRDGRQITVEVWGSRIIYKGRPAIIGTLMDVTAEQAREALLKENEARYRRLIEVCPEAILIHREGEIVFANPAAARLLGASGTDALQGKNLFDYVPPETTQKLRNHLRQEMEAHASGAVHEVPLRRMDGKFIVTEWVDVPFTYQNAPAVQTVLRDVTHRKETEQIFRGQKLLLEEITRGTELTEVLNKLVEFVESVFPDMLGSVLLLDQAAQRLYVAAAPHLPEAYNREINGITIGPRVGSCGTAAFLGEPVIVADIATHPLWEEYRDIALEHNLRACWSLPIFSRQGKVLGTLALYYREVREPTLRELELMEMVAGLAAIALENKRREGELLRREVQYQRLFNHIRELALVYGVDVRGNPTRLLEANHSVCRLLGYDRKALEQLPLSNLFTTDTYQAVARALEESRTSETSLVEAALQTRDGDTIPVEISLYRFREHRRSLILLLMRDIRERLSAENALRQSEANLKALFDNSLQAFFLIDKDERVLAVNRPAVEMNLKVFGKSIQPGNVAREFFSGEEYVAFRKAFEMALSGKKFSAERKIVGQNGREFWFEVNYMPVQDARGEILSVCLSALEITDRKQAEQALRESEERFRALVQNSSDIIAVLSADGAVRYQSPSIQTTLGYSPEALAEREVFEFVHPDDRPRLRTVYRALVKGKRLPRRLVEFRVRDAGGAWRYLEASASNQLNNPAVQGIIINARDITSRKQMQDALRESEERFRTVFENSGMGILLIRLNGRLLEANPALHAMLGYTPDQLQEKKLKDLCRGQQPFSRFSEVVKRLETEGPALQVECSLATERGEERWGRLTLSLVRNGEGVPQFVVAMIEDITERLQTLRELQESEEKYRLLFNSSMDAIYVYPLDETGQPGKFLAVNEVACRQTGFTREQLLDRTPRELLTPEQNQRFEEWMHRLQEKRHLLHEALYVTRSGRRLPVEVNANLFDYRGQPTVIATVRDISERKFAEAAIRASEERYRTLFEGVPIGLYRSTPEGVLLDANQALVSMLGYTSLEELQSIRLTTLYVDASHREKWRERLEAEGTLRGFEARLRRQDGTTIWVREHSRAVRNEAGEIVYFEGSLEDITPQKTMEEALKASEERYRDLVENSEDIIFTHNLDGVLLSANRAFARLMGYTDAHQMVGLHLSEILAPREHPRIEAYLERIAWQGHDADHVQVRTRTGETRILEYRNSVKWEGEKEPLVRGMARDVTEKVQAQKALAEERERLSVTLRSIGDGVIATDLTGRIILINNVAEELTGWTDAEALGKPIQEVFCIEAEASGQTLDPVAATLRSEKTVLLDTPVPLISRDGSRRMIQANAAPMRDEKQHLLGVVLVFRDVTRQLKLEEELHKAQKLESLGILAGGIAHDFNNILTAVIGNITLAQFSQDDPEYALQRLQEAEKAAEQARNLTQQLLTFAKGGAPVKKAALITDIIRETADFALHGSAVRCEYEFDDNIWPVEVDRGQINQVINNLVINAVQAMPDGGIIRITCRNHEFAQDAREQGIPLQPGKYVKITIQDQGIGIPREYLDRIFDPYFTTKQKGSGLGLATSYSIIKKHGGYIFVESEVSVGTTFTIYLPAIPEATPVSSSTEARELPRGEGRILIMDDEESVLNVATQMLHSLGYEVESARDGEEAIQKYREAREAGRPFDAVIMDLTVPGGMGGREAVQKLRQIDPHLKAIVSSGYSNDPVMAQFEEHGFVACIAKPYSVHKMGKTLQEVLGKPEAITDRDVSP